MRAVPSTSPFIALFSRINLAATGFENVTVAAAIAVRRVTGLDAMETICADPEGVRWVSFGVVGLDAWEREEVLKRRRRGDESAGVEKRFLGMRDHGALGWRS
jgi:hypothetical protein